MSDDDDDDENHKNPESQVHLTPWTVVVSSKSESGLESGFPDLRGWVSAG